MEDVSEPGDGGVGMFQVQCEGCGNWVPPQDSGLIVKALHHETVYRCPGGGVIAGVGTTAKDGETIPIIAQRTDSRGFWYCRSCWQSEGIDTVLRALWSGDILDHPVLHGRQEAQVHVLCRQAPTVRAPGVD
jgi:hypothetical protein